MPSVFSINGVKPSIGQHGFDPSITDMHATFYAWGPQLTSGLKYPESIVKAVNSKNQAIQDAMRAENELKVSQADAAKLIAKAEGERQANELRTKSITPLLLQQELINKWDGKLPVYGAVPQLFKGLTN